MLPNQPKLWFISRSFSVKRQTLFGDYFLFLLEGMQSEAERGMKIYPFKGEIAKL